MTHRETLAAWLQDAYAMEKALIPILENPHEERNMADWVHEQLPLLVEEHALKAAEESVRS